MKNATNSLETAFGRYRVEPTGIVINETDRLMWMPAPLGLTWNGEQWTGEPIKADWTTMTDRFGRGVDAYAHPEKTRLNLGQIVKEACEKSQFDRGYTRGSESIDFGGYTDWRLPTLAEAVTLSFNEEYGGIVVNRDILTDNYRSESIWRDLFGEQAVNVGFWIANRCHEAQLNSGQKIIDVASRLFRGNENPPDYYTPFVWIFFCDFRGPCIFDTGGHHTSQHKEQEAAALLVRSF